MAEIFTGDVEINGQLRVQGVRIPQAFTPPSGTSPEIFDVVYQEAGPPVVPGTPISSDGFRAIAASSTGSRVIGLALTGALTGFPVTVQSGGMVTLTAAEWDAVTGQLGGLTPGATYVLDVVAGKLTTIPPGAGGQYVTVIGEAVDALSMVIEVARPILL